MANIDFAPVLQEMDQIPNERFPEMLFNPMINEFDDDIGRAYWTDFDESNDMIDRAMNIGGVIKDYRKYLDEMDIWQEYMGLLAEKYGSIELVERGAEVGAIPEFVPRKPVLKKTKRNKALLRAGIVPSRRLFTPTFEGFFEFVKPEIDPAWKDISEDRMLEKVDKNTKKVLKRYANKMLVRDRLNQYTTNSHKSDVFKQINEIYESFRKGGYRKDTNADFISLTQLKKERKKMELTPDHLLDAKYDVSLLGLNMYGNTVYDTAKRRKMRLIQDLIDAGYDPYKFGVDGGITKKEIKIVISQMGSNVPENIKNGKMWKKMEKKKKKKMKELEASVSKNPAVARVLASSSFSLSSMASLIWDKD